MSARGDVTTFEPAMVPDARDASRRSRHGHHGLGDHGLPTLSLGKGGVLDGGTR
jgi:hypothetical protein